MRAFVVLARCKNYCVIIGKSAKHSAVALTHKENFSASRGLQSMIKLHRCQDVRSPKAETGTVPVVRDNEKRKIVHTAERTQPCESILDILPESARVLHRGPRSNGVSSITKAYPTFESFTIKAVGPPKEFVAVP